VDASLNNILTVLNQNFAQINYSLGILNGNVQDLESGLLEIQGELNRIEQYLLGWTTSLSKEQFVQAMNGCLGYRARTGADIGFAQYVNCENVAYTQAHDTALDQLWAGLDTPDYTDGNIYPTLYNFPLSVDINYLAQFPTKNLILPALSSTRLANPNEWALGARAYLQLASEWPQYASQVSSSRLDDLINVGTPLQQAVQNANSTKSGNTISGNQPLFAAVANKYGGAISGFQTAAQGVVDGYIADPVNGITSSATGIALSLFAGGANQHTSWRPSIGSISFCGGTAVGSAPTNVLQPVPDLYAFSQGYLSSGQLSMCIQQVQWLNLHSVAPFGIGGQGADALHGQGCAVGDVTVSFLGMPNEVVVGYNDGEGYWPRGGFVGFTNCLIGTISVTIDVQFGGATILTATAGQDAIAGFSYSTYYHNAVFGPIDPTAFVIANWTGVGDWRSTGLNLFQRLINSYQFVQLPQPQILSTIVTQLDGVARTHEQNIYRNISNAFGIASPVQSAGPSLAAGKLLLQAFGNLGLPNSLQTNDGLHALLYGNQSILDTSAVQSDFVGFSTGAIPDTTDNKITDEIVK